MSRTLVDSDKLAGLFERLGDLAETVASAPVGKSSISGSTAYLEPADARRLHQEARIWRSAAAIVASLPASESVPATKGGPP